VVQIKIEFRLDASHPHRRDVLCVDTMSTSDESLGIKPAKLRLVNTGRDSMLRKQVMRHLKTLPVLILRDEPYRFESSSRAPADILTSHQGFQFGWQTILPDIESLLKMTVRMGRVF